jgi:hypothetical protein
MNKFFTWLMHTDVNSIIYLLLLIAVISILPAFIIMVWRFALGGI